MKVSNKVTLLGAAVASLFATVASAQIVLPATGASTGSKIYAREITSGSATTGIITNAANAFNVQTRLGVGMSANQDRYLRIRLSNAVFHAAFAPPAVGINATTAFAAATIALGGGAGTNEVIIQVTGAAAGNQIADALTFVLPNLRFASTTSTATVSYDVFEFLNQAQAGTPSLYSRSGNLARFQPSLSFANHQATGALSTTATAVSQFFAINGGTGFGSATSAKVGDVALTVPTYASNIPTNTAPFLVDGATNATAVSIIDTAATAPANRLNLTGDLTAAAAAGSVTTTGGLTQTATAITANTATIPIAATGITAAGFASTVINYALNGTTALPKSAYTTSFTYAANTNYSGATLGPITTGNIERDGATFESPWVTSTPGFISRFFLTQTSPATVTYTAIVRNKDGLVTGGTLTGSLLSNRQTTVTLASLLPADTTAVPGPYQVTFNLTSDATQSQGTYVLTTPSGAVSNTPLYRAANR